jgi:hypothetical protein
VVGQSLGWRQPGSEYGHRRRTAKLFDVSQCRKDSNVFPDGSSVSNRYDRLDLAAAKDRLGAWSYFGYDALRQKVAETNANAVVTRGGRLIAN